MVYDFLEQAGASRRVSQPTGGKPGRFILLEPAQRIRTEISTDQLSGAMTKLRTGPPAGRSIPAVRGQSRVQGIVRAGTASSCSPAIWRATRSARPPPSIRALAEYREFLDWYTQLNTLLSAGPPPEPRLRLNAALARHEVVPLNVELNAPARRNRCGPSTNSPGGSPRGPRPDRRRAGLAGELSRGE